MKILWISLILFSRLLTPGAMSTADLSSSRLSEAMDSLAIQPNIPESSIREYAVSSLENFEISIWRRISFEESPGKVPDERVARLKSRPNDIFFFLNPVNTIHPKANVCFVNIASEEISDFLELNLFSRVDIYFYCSEYCCGMECCEVNQVTVSLIVFLVSISACVSILYCCRKCDSKKCTRFWRNLCKAKAKRVRRMNARRERVSETRAGSPDAKASIRRSVKRQVSTKSARNLPLSYVPHIPFHSRSLRHDPRISMRESSLSGSNSFSFFSSRMGSEKWENIDKRMDIPEIHITESKTIEDLENSCHAMDESIVEYV